MKVKVSARYIMIGAVMAVILTIGIVGAQWATGWSDPTIAPPPEYAEASLRVDITLLRCSMYGKCRPQPGAEISGAEIACPLLDASGSDPSWYGWCRQSAMNMPMRTDENGRGVLWFNLQPDPHRISLAKDTFGPSVSIQTEFDRVQGKPEMLANDHWQVEMRAAGRQ